VFAVLYCPLCDLISEIERGKTNDFDARMSVPFRICDETVSCHVDEKVIASSHRVEEGAVSCDVDAAMSDISFVGNTKQSLQTLIVPNYSSKMAIFNGRAESLIKIYQHFLNVAGRNVELATKQFCSSINEGEIILIDFLFGNDERENEELPIEKKEDVINEEQLSATSNMHVTVSEMQSDSAPVDVAETCALAVDVCSTTDVNLNTGCDSSGEHDDKDAMDTSDSEFCPNDVTDNSTDSGMLQSTVIL
jgi:hypothetical protein